MDAGDHDTFENINKLSQNCNLQNHLLLMQRDEQTYGRAFMQFVMGTIDGELTIAKIYHPDPTYVTIIRDNKEDLGLLQTHFPDNVDGNGKTLDRKGEGIDPENPGNTGRIVGFIVRNDEDPEAIPTFFNDDELVVFLRFPMGRLFRDGISLIRANYTLIANKLGMEKDGALVYQRWYDPKMVVKLPSRYRGMKDTVRADIADVKMETGTNIIVDDDMETDLLEGKNGGYGLNYVKDDNNKNIVAGIGGFDAMTDGSTANRAVAEVQDAIFARKLKPFRDDMENVLNKRVFDVYCKRNPKIKSDYILPEYKWGSLVPADKVAFLGAQSFYAQYMTESQMQFLLKEFGNLPIPLDGEETYQDIQQQRADELFQRQQDASMQMQKVQASQQQAGPPGQQGSQKTPQQKQATKVTNKADKNQRKLPNQRPAQNKPAAGGK
jgi:hypothetical protein